MLRATEGADPTTKDLDVSDPVKIATILGTANARLFNDCFSQANFLEKLEGLVESVKASSTGSSLTKPTKIIMSGAGTSGRLAFVAARGWAEAFSKQSSHIHFEYLIAGGDSALVKGQEVAEDNTDRAQSDLISLLGPSDSYHHAVYIGITCGLSAPYVASQIDWILRQNSEKFTCVLMGFNEVSLARDVPIENWGKTVFQVVQELNNKAISQDGRHYIINPIYGPEPIAGSTRMKGGTVTKILIDSILTVLLSTGHSFKDIFETYEKTHQYTFQDLTALGSVIQAAGQSLCAEGHVYYLGCDEIGIMGLVDASECPPTYGAAFTDIKGILLDGWEALKNKEGSLEDPARCPAGELDIYSLSHRYFESKILSTLSPKDTIVILHHGSPSNLERLDGLVIDAAKASPDSTYILVDWGSPSAAKTASLIKSTPLRISVTLPSPEMAPGVPSFASLSAKWVLNTLTTGGFVRKGKVYQNVMIDLGLSNNKLYERAIKMVSRLSGVDEAAAEVAILQSIYLTKEVSEVRKNPVSVHNHVAFTKRKQVVPLALLIASKKFTVESGLGALKKEPVVRNLIKEYLN